MRGGLAEVVQWMVRAGTAAAQSPSPARQPPPDDKMPTTNAITDSPHLQQATLGGGCFWCLEAAFNQLGGVVLAESGYSNGHHPSPSYEAVCSGTTGHAEVVRVTFDPERISYRQLLTVFFSLHDPTTLNRQGPDSGSQYRSVIFFHTPEQEKAAKLSKERLEESRKFKDPVVTEIIPAQAFYKAEEYHQRYFEKRGIKPTCHIPTK
jgi:peptide-methionine (S)-S-oxide reductase